MDDDAILAGVRAASEPAWRELWAAVDQLVPDDDAILRLERSLYDVGAIVPFDWAAWNAPRRYPGGTGLADAPAADAVRTLTSIIRGERFSTGAIVLCIENGLLPAALQRLRRWYDDERGAHR